MRLLFLSTALVVLAACGKSLDTTVDVATGWGDYAWGTDQAKVEKDLGLEDADRTVEGRRTTVKSGRIRKLNGAKANVRYIFVGGKLAGVALFFLSRADPDDARAGMIDWFGPETEPDGWRKGLVRAKLIRVEEGPRFLVVIFHDEFALKRGD